MALKSKPQGKKKVLSKKKSPGEKSEDKKKVTQARINPDTGEVEDRPEDEIEEDLLESDDKVSRDSQAKIAAVLTGIVLKPSQRTFALKVVAPKMVEEVTRIYRNQKAFIMKFRVPTRVESGKVIDFEDVEFETRLIDLTLKGNGATLHGHISHEGACAMSNLIHNWKGGVEFFLDGIQQSLI